MKNEKNIVGLGEMMLRLTAPRGRLIPDAGEFNASYGGGEANVLISLSHLDHKTVYLSRLPTNELGFACKKKLLAHEVDCSNIIMDNHTLGMYFVDIAEGSRSSNTLYNRKHSSASHMKKLILILIIFSKMLLFFILLVLLLQYQKKLEKLLF